MNCSKAKEECRDGSPWLLDEIDLKCAPQPEAPGQAISPFSRDSGGTFQSAVCSTLRVVVF